MYIYDEECLKTFLKDQLQLFDEKVADSEDEADAFLEECMAVVVKSEKEVRDYFDEAGMDISEMDIVEILEASEVFKLPSGRFLIVEA